jgi:hypothetical protein
MLSAACGSLAEVTGSRARVFFGVSSQERELKAALSRVRRELLLGRRVEDAVGEAAAALASYSASASLEATADPSNGGLRERGEEAQGILGADLLSRETKFPVFMTACFFSPVLLLLLAVFLHLLEPLQLAELLALEVLFIDAAFFACSPERGGRG